VQLRLIRNNVWTLQCVRRTRKDEWPALKGFDAQAQIAVQSATSVAIAQGHS